MLALGELGVIMSGIVEYWVYNENHAEATFTLREGVKFHDGFPIDAKTVKYSIEADFMVTFQDY